MSKNVDINAMQIFVVKLLQFINYQTTPSKNINYTTALHARMLSARRAQPKQMDIKMLHT